MPTEPEMKCSFPGAARRNGSRPGGEFERDNTSDTKVFASVGLSITCHTDRPLLKNPNSHPSDQNPNLSYKMFKKKYGVLDF